VSAARLVVSGTDTGIGKTVFSAALADALGASYWKPVQAGLDEETDAQTVARLGELTPARIVPEVWRLQLPASPHLSAAREGVAIDADALTPPDVRGALVIEGAGGLMVPLARDRLFIDVFARWRLPLVLCARTALGTINHTLLSIEALKQRNIPILGIAFIGDDQRDTMSIIGEMSGVRVLGRLPRLEPLTRETLAAAFAANFRRDDFGRSP
jgi:dethiobiotin synthetase